MIQTGEGGYAMPTNPIKKPFRMAFPSVDEVGNEIIINYPKCTIAPVDMNNETEREETAEKLQQFMITAIPMYHKGDLDQSNVYYIQSLDTETTKAKYDRNKLLEQGWFDKASLKKCEAAGVPGS